MAFHYFDAAARQIRAATSRLQWDLEASGRPGDVSWSQVKAESGLTLSPQQEEAQRAFWLAHWKIQSGKWSRQRAKRHAKQYAY